MQKEDKEEEEIHWLNYINGQKPWKSYAMYLIFHFFLLNKNIIFDIPIFHLERSMGIFLSNDFLLHDILTLGYVSIGINLRNQSFRPIDIIPVIQARWDLLPLSSPVSPILATTVFTMQQTPTF